MLFVGPLQASTYTAYADILLVIDGSSCEPDLGGTWDSTTNTCTLPSMTLSGETDLEVASGVTVYLPSGDHIEIGSGRTFIIGSESILHLDVGSFIELDSNSFLINNGGTLNNDGIIAGDGIFQNKAGGIINNEAGGIDPFGGILTNDGTLNNVGVIDTLEGAKIQNNGVVNNIGTVKGSHAMSNSGTFKIFDSGTYAVGTVNNTGTFENSGIVDFPDRSRFFNEEGILQNEVGGKISMDEALLMNIGSSILYNNGTILNNGRVVNDGGTIENNDGGSVTGAGSFSMVNDSILNNHAGGIISIDGDNFFNVESGSSINNNGAFTTLTQTVIISGNGLINNNEGGILTSSEFGAITVNSGGTIHNHPGSALKVILGGDLNILVGGIVVVDCGATFDNNGGTVTGEITFEPCDDTAPAITILGPNPATALQGQPYADQGATVSDDIDPTPTLTTVSTVNTAILGSYAVTYTAEDDAGNSSTATRTVNVVEAFCGKPITAYNVIDGTSGKNTLTGTAGNDLIRGFGGNDIIKGNGGDDCLFGGAGNDVISGGAGNDEMYGEAGLDAMDGGDGNDKMFGGEGLDALLGGTGNDSLDGGAGNDVMEGWDGNDQIVGAAGTDLADGGKGTDSCAVEKKVRCES